MPGIGIGLSPCFTRRRQVNSLPQVFSDGTAIWRLIADNDEAFNWQFTLNETGFAGTEDIDFYTTQMID